MTKNSFVALLGLLLGLQGLLNASAGRTSGYERPPARPLLPLEHKQLSLAGPGSMAGSWRTYPQVSITRTFAGLYLARVACNVC